MQHHVVAGRALDLRHDTPAARNPAPRTARSESALCEQMTAQARKSQALPNPEQTELGRALQRPAAARSCQAEHISAPEVLALNKKHHGATRWALSWQFLQRAALRQLEEVHRRRAAALFMQSSAPAKNCQNSPCREQRVAAQTGNNQEQALKRLCRCGCVMAQHCLPPLHLKVAVWGLALPSCAKKLMNQALRR